MLVDNNINKVIPNGLNNFTITKNNCFRKFITKRTIIREIFSINLKKKIVKSDCSVTNLEIKRSKTGVNLTFEIIEMNYFPIFPRV